MAKKILIQCIDDKNLTMVKLNRKYIATSDGDNYIINLEENNIKKPHEKYNRKSTKVKKFRFIALKEVK